MDTAWHYVVEGKPAGPVSEAHLRSLHASGAVSAATLVWRSGMPAWQPLGSVASLADGDGHPGQAMCSQCRGLFAAEDVIHFGELAICGACKPLFVQRLKEGEAIPGRGDAAGFWIRFGARFIDGMIQAVGNILLALPLSFVAAAGITSPARTMAIQGVILLIQFAVGIAYETFFLGRFGATPGKMACRLRVIRTDGSPLSYARACGRYFAALISALTLYIGFLMAAWSEDKRALHDHICDTRVVRA